MRTRTRVLLVLAGYLLAVVTSVLAVTIYDHRFTAADNATMGGMIAGGEMMYGVGVFLFVALFPTAFALWSLRRHRGFWSAFAALCLAFAVLGLPAVIEMHLTRGIQTPRNLWVDLFAIVQMFGAPLWIGGFAVFALLAPARGIRRVLLVSTGIEVLIGLAGFVHILRPFTPF